MHTRAHKITLFLAFALSATGCVQQRDPINRVQPDYLDKRDFIPNQYAQFVTGAAPGTVTATLLAKEPVFYTQTTMIAKPTTTGFTGLTRYSEADKIRWDVTEKFLIARQSYEFIKNAPTGGSGIGNNVQTGDPVVVFEIKSHFDIKNAYNTTTGEVLNVVEENTTDRPWYQRQFMRVDWSQNLVSSYNSVLAEAQWDGRLQSEPVPVFVNSPTDPNAPVFEWNGAGDSRKLVYFDIVNKAILHPETTTYSYQDRPGSTSSFSALPLCQLVGEGSIDCAPAEVTFRVAFRRTDPARDYEPAPVNLPIPDQSLNGQSKFQHLDMERFGFFDQARVGYDPVQHVTLDNYRMHFASRHNLWVHHHLLSVGTDSSKACNFDADCGGDLVCHIAKDGRVDASHRGYCAAIAPSHDPSDLHCATNDDCLQTFNGTGQSATAFCDTATKTCAERYVRCGSDDACQKLDANSTCDLAIAYNRADNRGMCLMPFLQRQVRPIAYHESTGYPDYMQPVTEQIVTEWNDAFRTAVVAARRRECEINRNLDAAGTALDANPCNDPAVVGTDGSPGADARFPFVGCHSPVWGTASGPGQHTAAEVEATHAKGWDLAACGPQGTNARIGDLRYSMIGAITDHDAQGYWGLANIASDPETGEMVAGRGAVWQTITDAQAQYLVTLVRLLTGDLDPGSVSNGDYIIDSMKQLGTAASPSNEILDAPLRQPGSLTRITQMRTGLDDIVLPGRGWLSPSTPLFSMDNNHPGAMVTGQQRIQNSRLLGDGTARGTQRLLSLAGSPLEGMLMNEQQTMLAQTHSPDPTGQLAATLDMASPMRMQSKALRRVADDIRSRFSAYECGYEATFSDDMLLGLAQRLATGDPILRSNPLDAGVAFGRDWDFRVTRSNGTKTSDWNLMAQYAAQFIHHGVLAHEIGHSLGQRHNFAASADAINYFDQYWLVRGKGHATKPGDPLPGLRPRFDYVADPRDGSFYSQDEIDGRVDEWSYSSVMDYKGLNEDAHGLGRYDYAFIKNGYVGIVEAWRKATTDNNLKAVYYGENAGGTGLSTPLDLSEWGSQGNGPVHGMHYTQIPTIYGTKMGSDGQTMVPDIGDDARYNVFLRETCGLGDSPGCASISGFGTPRFSNATADGHLLVPYRFDSDGRAGLIWQVQRYDSGADAYESLHYVTQRVLDYYFVNSFARLRSGFSTKKYVDRIWGRYLEQLRQCTQTLAFDMVQFADFLDSTNPTKHRYWLAYKNDPKEYGAFINQAVQSMSTDTLVGLLTFNDTSYHGSRPQFDGTQLVQKIQEGNYVSQIPVNQGRTFESQWRQDVGFFWYEQLNSAGSYYDKVMAVQALTDPDLHLLQRDTPTDIRLFQLSYYTMYPDQMIRLFGGILSEDYQDFAPIVNLANSDQSSISINRTHVAGLNLPPGLGANQSGRLLDAGHVAIDPQDHFTIQLWAIVHGMTQFPATYDQRYADYGRLWVDGSVEAITVQNPDVNTVSFTDPWSHVTYRALHIGTRPGESGQGVGASPTFHLAAGKATCSMDSDCGGGNLVCKSGTCGYFANEAGIGARAILHLQDLDAARLAAIAKNDAPNAQLLTLKEQQYIDVIQAMREVTARFAHGYSATP